MHEKGREGAAYERDGAKWRQRAYWVPLDTEAVYVLRVKAASDVTATMFAAADLVATSFRPRR